MNNLSSYCGLVDAKIRASDKDLPVHKKQGIVNITWNLLAATKNSLICKILPLVNIF